MITDYLDLYNRKPKALIIPGRKPNIGTLKIRTEFWGMLYYNQNTEPPE